MGIEGHESPRDVASEEKKHPWDVFPDGETSAEDGGKKREKTEKKEGKFKLPKNKFALVGIFVFVVLLGVGIFFGIKLLSEKKKGNEYYDGPEAEILTSVGGKITVDKAATPDLAYNIAVRKLKEAMNAGVQQVGAENAAAIMKDNVEVYIDKLEQESDKKYYLMIATDLFSLKEEFEIAETYLKDIDKYNYDDLDKNQKYAYIICHKVYYMMKEDEEKMKEYVKMLDEEFPEDEGYIESGTNNVIEAPKWEDK